MQSEGNIETNVRNVLKKVYDPELGINIVDLGLVYGIEFIPDEGIVVTMTLTSPSCPMGEMITENVEQAIEWNFREIPVKVNVVFDPEWHPDMMSDEAKSLM